MMKRNMKKIIALLSAIAVVVTSVIVVNPTKTVEAATAETVTNDAGQTVVYLPGFEHVTLSDFINDDINQGQGMPDGEYTTAYNNTWFELRDAEGNAVESMDKTVVSMKVDFNKQSATQDFVMYLATKGNTNTGIQLYASASGMSLFLQGVGGGEAQYQQIKAGASLPEGTNTSEFFFSEKILQVSFELVASDADNVKNDLKIGIYVDGIAFINDNSEDDRTWIFKDYNVSEKFGTNVGVYFNNTNFKMNLTSVEVPEPEVEEQPQYVNLEEEGFRNISVASFVNDTSSGQMQDEIHSESKGFHLKNDLNGDLIDSYDKTLLSMKVKFGAAETNAYINRIEVLGKDENHYFGIYPAANGKTLRFVNVGENAITAGYQDSYIRAVELTDAEDVTNFFIGNLFTLQIAFEYGNFDDDTIKDDLKIRIFYNGTECQVYNNGTLSDGVIPNCNMENFGQKLRLLVASGNSIEINSFDPTAPEGPTKTFHDLATGNYSLADLEGQVYLNGEATALTELTIPGDYEIAVGSADNVVAQLKLYGHGHANLDENGDLDVRDLMATRKLQAGKQIQSTGKAALLGADFDNSGSVKSEDVSLIQKNLVE